MEIENIFFHIYIFFHSDYLPGVEIAYIGLLEWTFSRSYLKSNNCKAHFMRLFTDYMKREVNYKVNSEHYFLIKCLQQGIYQYILFIVQKDKRSKMIKVIIIAFVKWSYMKKIIYLVIFANTKFTTIILNIYYFFFFLFF